MCGHNLTIAEPNESLQIDFNVLAGDELSANHPTNCTSFIVWSGLPQFKLYPFTARSNTVVRGINDHPQVVLSITDVQGKIIKLDMFGPKPFYLSITPMLTMAPLQGMLELQTFKLSKCGKLSSWYKKHQQSSWL